MVKHVGRLRQYSALCLNFTLMLRDFVDMRLDYFQGE